MICDDCGNPIHKMMEHVCPPLPDLAAETHDQIEIVSTGEIREAIQAMNESDKFSKWDARFMALAEHIADWSKDPSTKVGAVIVNSMRGIVGLGFNGFPRGVEDHAERYANKPTKYKMIVHSEANAILNANSSVNGCAMYTTKFPCSDCAKLIIQSGICQVFAPPPISSSGDGPWVEDAKFSFTMFQEAGVAVFVVR